MLRTIQRLVHAPPPLPPRDWSEMQAWSAAQGHEFKREKENRGFALLGRVPGEPPLGGRPWRLEWGPSQREYIVGPELRIRASLGLPQELQMLCMPLGWMDALERETFQRVTEQAQTEVDIGMPEEMRWLALFRRVPMTACPALKGQVGSVAAIAGTAEAWLRNEALQSGLLKASESGANFVLMTLRGRLYLRHSLREATPQGVQATLGLLAVAVPALVPVVEAIGRRVSSGFASSHGGETQPPAVA